MDQNICRITSHDLAAQMLDKVEKTAIIPKLFSILEFTFVIQSSTDLKCLDALIRDFEDSDYSGVEILTKIIDLIRDGLRASNINDSELLYQIYHYLDSTLTDDVSLDRMSKDLHVSYSYLIRFVRSALASEEMPKNEPGTIDLTVKEGELYFKRDH